MFIGVYSSLFIGVIKINSIEIYAGFGGIFLYDKVIEKQKNKKEIFII